MLPKKVFTTVVASAEYVDELHLVDAISMFFLSPSFFDIDTTTHKKRDSVKNAFLKKFQLYGWRHVQKWYKKIQHLMGVDITVL